jgi:hypothetical protein
MDCCMVQNERDGYSVLVEVNATTSTVVVVVLQHDPGTVF